MADLPPFLDVPGVPGGRVALAGLSPDAQQRYLAQYGGAPELHNTPGGIPVDPSQALLMNPVMTDQQKQSLHDTFRFLPSHTPDDTLAVDRAIQDAKAGGFNMASQAPAAPVAPTAPQTGTQSLPPTGPASGPLGAATATLKGSFPAVGGMPMPGVGGSREKAWLKANEEKERADVAAAEAGRTAAIQTASAQDEYAKQVERFNAQAAEKEAQRQRYVDDQLNTVKAAQAELQKPGQPVDPDHYWKNKGAGQKVLAGIAVFLSGLGSGLQGRAGQNQALDYIQGQVDKDIQLQKESASNERERKRDALTGNTNMYRMFIERGMDERQAEAATRLTMAQGLDTKLQSLMAKSKVDTYTAGIQQLIAANHVNIQKGLEDLSNNSAQRFGQIAAGTAALENAATNRFEVGLKAAAGGKDPETYVPGVGWAVTKDAAKDVREKAGAYKEARDTINKLLDWRKKYGGEVLNRSAVAEARTLKGALIGQVNKLYKFGALDKGTQELVTEMVGGDPTSFGSKVDSALETLGGQLDSGFNKGIEPYMAQRERNADYYKSRMEPLK